MKKGFTIQNFFKKNLGGFTLVEMLVAMTVFVIVVTIASTIFVHAIRAQRLNLAYQELLDQTSYVMEYMSRSIRMAMKDDIGIWGFGGKSCITGNNKENYEFDVLTQCLKFRNYKDQCQEFCLADAGGGRKKLVESIDGDPPIDLTSPSLNIGPLPPHLSWVEVSGERQTDAFGQPDTDQPRVTILLQIEGREEAKIQIQTSISQRNLDTVK